MVLIEGTLQNVFMRYVVGFVLLGVILVALPILSSFLTPFSPVDPVVPIAMSFAFLLLFVFILYLPISYFLFRFKLTYLLIDGKPTIIVKTPTTQRQFGASSNYHISFTTLSTFYGYRVTYLKLDIWDSWSRKTFFERLPPGIEIKNLSEYTQGGGYLTAQLVSVGRHRGLCGGYARSLRRILV